MEEDKITPKRTLSDPSAPGYEPLTKSPSMEATPSPVFHVERSLKSQLEIEETPEQRAKRPRRIKGPCSRVIINNEVYRVGEYAYVKERGIPNAIIRMDRICWERSDDAFPLIEARWYPSASRNVP